MEHLYSGEIVQWCVGVVRNGERLQQCSTKPFVYRVPLKEIQGSGHSDMKSGVMIVEIV